MSLNEINYYNYRNSVNNKAADVFKYGREILVISPVGVVEEIGVGPYHFRTLYRRFCELPLADKEDEFVTSCAAAKVGYIVFIVDYDNLCIFFPEALVVEQREIVLSILKHLDDEYMLYAVSIPSAGELRFQELCNGESVSAKDMRDEIQKIPVVESQFLNEARK